MTSISFIYNNRFKYARALIVAAFMLCALPISALASGKVDPFAFRGSSNESITRTDPFDDHGEPYHYNGFILSPLLKIEQAYTDNVLATDNNEISDTITRVSPSLSIERRFGRHNMALSLEGEINKHWRRNEEDHVNFDANFNANFEARRGINVPLTLSYRNNHSARETQKRTSVADLSIEPLQQKTLNFEGGLMFNPNRLTFGALAGFRGVRLENGRQIGTNAALIRDTRDVNNPYVRGLIEYQTDTGWRPYIETRFGQENFINEAAGAPSRNNELIRVLAGTRFDFKGLLYGSLGAGWEKRRYDDPSVATLSGLSLNGNLFWQPTAKTKVGLNFSRETIEDESIGTGIKRSEAKLNISRELRRNLFLRLNSAYENERFTETARTDKTYGVGAQLAYILSSGLKIGGEYKYLTRASTLSGLDLNSSVFLISAQTDF